MHYRVTKIAYYIRCVLSVALAGAHYSQSAWTLRRAASIDNSRLIFRNTTVTGELTYCTWLWMDQREGVWDVSVRVWLSTATAAAAAAARGEGAGRGLMGGYFQYRDVRGRGLLRVDWRQTATRPLTWTQSYAWDIPRTSWNLTVVDYARLDYEWTEVQDAGTFHVDGAPIRPIRRPATATVAAYGDDALWPTRWRGKRGANRRKTFDILDLFTGNGIFASLPQLFIDIFSFFANLFSPATDDADDSAFVETTEPDAETLPTPSSTTSTTSTATTATTQTAAETTTMVEPETLTEQTISESPAAPLDRMKEWRPRRGGTQRENKDD